MENLLNDVEIDPGLPRLSLASSPANKPYRIPPPDKPYMTGSKRLCWPSCRTTIYIYIYIGETTYLHIIQVIQIDL